MLTKMKNWNWTKIAMVTGVVLTTLGLVIALAFACYVAYQYKLDLDATHLQLLAVSKELAREQAKVADATRCFELLNSGRLLPEITQKGTEYIITYDCR
jgi:hypothetical protein